MAVVVTLVEELCGNDSSSGACFDRVPVVGIKVRQKLSFVSWYHNRS